MFYMKGNLFVISSPSGAGKSSLISALLKRHNDMKVSVSHTTRAPRPGEEDGVHYHFCQVDEFKSVIADDGFYEWAEVFGNFYGTSKQAIQEQLDQGIDVFLDIDWQGAQQMRKIVPDIITLFILPPSREELENRLNKRGQDSAEVIAKRMQQAQSEMSHYNEYDFVLVNDDFDQTLDEFERIVLAHRLQTGNIESKYADLIRQLLAKS
ncbi:guanylate kinase [Psychrosphaera ytuae]|uniref:Guanylate kinase n=2 Tax=Psychrosphaera ytuae TaxID=2820710 RepID=A0A975D9Z1_9GAMM|nr:guanylate kinase [Psychrosphaera ytuae]QTH63272.1 guanylate kinase [Psychrosphaera ytuae]